MKKNNGFTLIELIGVITLLALIVLVSVPVIINTLNKTEQNEYENFEKLIINAAELYLERNRDLYPNFNDIGSSIDITTDTLINEGYLRNDLENPVNTSISKYKIVVTIGQDEIFEYKLVERKTIGELVTTTEEVTSIPACVTDGTNCTVGTAVALKVNETNIYNFYVLADDGNELTLIMDRNLGDNVEWYADENNSYGPTTAVTALKERTSSWTNIPEKEYTYSDDGGGNKYTAFTETMRARMLTYTEATTTLGCTTSSGSCPSWLYINLYTTGSDTDESGNTRYGYWTSAAYASYSDSAHTIYYDGNVYGNGTYDSRFGIRPVITVSRSL